MRNPNGGGTVILGVAWYDAPFFEDRKEAWRNGGEARVLASRPLALKPMRLSPLAGVPDRARSL